RPACRHPRAGRQTWSATGLPSACSSAPAAAPTSWCETSDRARAIASSSPTTGISGSVGCRRARPQPENSRSPSRRRATASVWSASSVSEMSTRRPMRSGRRSWRGSMRTSVPGARSVSWSVPSQRTRSRSPAAPRTISTTSPRRGGCPTFAPSTTTRSPTCTSMGPPPHVVRRGRGYPHRPHRSPGPGADPGSAAVPSGAMSQTPPGPHVAIVGTTASGKSALALELARRDPSIEIVSVDSMQVYRGMDIGTAKPTPAERAEVPHHLIDVVDPWEDFTVAWFAREARRAVAEITARGHRALLVGGTGLYLRAVVDDLQVPGRYPEVRAALEADRDTVGLHRRLRELDPVAAGRMEPTNRRRVIRALEVTLGSGRPFSSYGPGLDVYPPSRFHLVGVRLPHEVVARRIAARYEQQMAAGFLDEVRRLLAHPRGMSR